MKMNYRRELLLITSSSLFLGLNSCEEKKAELPPAESAQGKIERLEKEKKMAIQAKLDAAKKKNEALQRQIQAAINNSDAYDEEELKNDKKMDPTLRDALLQVKQMKRERKEKREEALALREKEMQRRLSLEKSYVDFKKIETDAQKEMKLIIKDQQAREEKERKEMNQPDRAPKGMVWIPSGKFIMGSSTGDGELFFKYPEEYPAHVSEVNGFYMDETEVTNAQFSEFVKATGYKTLAERGLDAKEFPKARPQDLQGGANVFKKTTGKIDPWRGSAWRWWSFTPGATWQTPQGPGSDIKDKMDLPVVCVNYDDATAYAKWAGKRLPTEAEWERAARGGKVAQKYIWGSELQPDGKWQANVFQGEFPSSLKDDDGFYLQAPVKSYPANAWGLYDMAGNVWEICSDYFQPGYFRQFVKNPVKNPKGPIGAITDEERVMFDRETGTCPAPRMAHQLSLLRTVKGGSFLCSTEYCWRFRPAARHHMEGLTPSHHIGFRCVKDIKK